MTCLKFTFPALVNVTAIFTQPLPGTVQTLLERNQEFIGMLAFWSRDPFAAGVKSSFSNEVSQTEAAVIEYASWLPDPGAAEFASWAVNLRTFGR